MVFASPGLGRIKINYTNRLTIVAYKNDGVHYRTHATNLNSAIFIQE